MKIVNENIETIIELNKECFYSLVLENQVYYREFLNKIVKQINEKEEFLLLYDKGEKLDFSKEVCFIESSFNMNIEEKKLSNYIQKDIVKNLKDIDKEKFNELVLKINEYLKEITFDYDINLNFNDNISINDFIKSYDIKADFDEENFLLTFINKVKSLRILINKNIFIFNNLHLYFTKEEIETIKDEMNKLEIYFINISSFNLDLASNEKVIIIDKDLCEITLNI